MLHITDSQDEETKITLIESAIMAGMMPVGMELTGSVMLSNGKYGIFVPSGRFYDEEKISAMRTLAKSRNLDPDLYVKPAMANPNSIEKITGRLYSGIVDKFRQEFNKGGQEAELLPYAVDIIEKNGKRLGLAALTAGFDEKTTMGMVNDVSQTIKSLRIMMQEPTTNSTPVV